MSGGRSSASDAGLQYERTALSWRRTALGALGICALLAHQAASDGWGREAIAPIVAIGTALLLAIVCFIRSRRLHEGHPGIGRAWVLAIACAVAVLAIVDIIGQVVR